MRQSSGFSLFDALNESSANIFSQPKIWGRAIPRDDWRENEFYRNLKNTVWLEITDGNFPATINPDKTTHTLFVQSISGYGIQVCPTSTKMQRQRPCHYIPKGMKLLDSDRELKKDVYVISFLTYPFPDEEVDGEDELYYAGNFPFSAMLELE